MRLLFWDLPFTCIGSLIELLGKPLASDRVGRATSVWFFSFNANSGFLLLLEHLSCFLPQLQAGYRQVKASIQGATLNSN